MKSSVWIATGTALVVAGIAAVALRSCGRRSREAAEMSSGAPARTAEQAGDADRPELHVHRAPGVIAIDGELADPGWAGAVARTGC